MLKIKNFFLNIKRKKKIFIIFIIPGDLNINLTIKFMHILIKTGIHVIEIGIPFSDPVAEGIFIQKSSERILKFGISIKNILNFIKKFRKINKFTPLIFMGYMNTYNLLNKKIYIKKINNLLINNFIIVDFPIEEYLILKNIIKKKNINQIFLISSNTFLKRIKRILNLSKCFIYYVSLKGTTGSKNIFFNKIKKKIKIVKNNTNLPLMIGFGINKKNIKNIINFSDGIIIGSNFLKFIQNLKKKNIFINIINYIKNIKLNLL
ncbi:tryptophan synthase, alpha subunit [Candidatus Zinderia insecticola CARI]|uniref:Tryptophan synthase alpha chain n=1 Tax=Zinderia insecticola (strain CARI) TaxID=871271 RepID=E0TIS9_ZINIC|nr:tryptophan synthase, alpha subunit [Candidatus Zinderia insecticola CARI]